MKISSRKLLCTRPIRVDVKCFILPNPALRDVRGFTLIEIVLYIGLLAMFLGSAFMFVNSVLSTSDVLIARNELLAHQELMRAKLQWLVNQATSILIPTANTSGNQLTLIGPQTNIFPAVFTVSGTDLFLSLGGEGVLALTNNQVQVTRFLARHFSTLQASSSLLITLDLQSSHYSSVTTTNTFAYLLP